MNASVQGYLGTPDRSGQTSLGLRGECERRALPPGVERDAHAAARDWQIILHLKRLFERDPALITALLETREGEFGRAYAATLLAAAREALAARSDSADQHYHTGRAAARLGRLRDARALLSRAVELDPGHVEALACLADACMEMGEPQHAVVCLRRALAAAAVRPQTVPPGRRRQEWK